MQFKVRTVFVVSAFSIYMIKIQLKNSVYWLCPVVKPDNNQNWRAHTGEYWKTS